METKNLTKIYYDKEGPCDMKSFQLTFKFGQVAIAAAGAQLMGATLRAPRGSFIFTYMHFLYPIYHSPDCKAGIMQIANKLCSRSISPTSAGWISGEKMNNLH